MKLSAFLPRLEARERGRFYLAAVAFMCVATSALIARATGDVLFLSSFGSAPLPFLYVGGALATGLGAYACARAARSLSTALIAGIAAAALILGNLGVLLTLSVLPAISRTSAYLLADLAGRIPVLLYWAFVTELFDARESRRLFGLLGAAGTAACLPAGLLVGPIAKHFGMSSLVLVVCGLLGAFILAVRALERRRVYELAPGDRRTLIATNLHIASSLHRNSQFLAIAALAAITSLVQTLVDYQFKTTFTSLESDAALAAIFGGLYGYTSLAALFLQLFVVHRFLRWGGVALSLCALPVSLVAASTGILQTMSAGWVYAAKALDITLMLTVTGTARQMLYRGVRRESRLQARALAEGIYQPLAVAIAGCILAFVVDSLTVRVAAGVTIALCLVWILVARSAYSTYISGLIGSLRARRLDADDEPFAPREPAVEAHVRNVLASGSDDEVIYLAGVLLPQLGNFAGTPELRCALAREDSGVKVALLDYLRENADPANLPAVRALAGDGDADVRWAAVRAATTGAARADQGWLRERLADPDPRVRAAAAAGLIDSGIEAAATDGMTALGEMVLSVSAVDRRAAAEGLRDTELGAVGPLLARLLQSTEPEVLGFTLEACCSHPDPMLLAGILPLLADKRLAAAASDALVAVGPAASRPVAAFLRKRSTLERTEAVKKLAGALARSGGADALPLLERMLLLVGIEDQAPVFQAVGDLINRQPSSAPFVRELETLISAETRAARARMDEIRVLSGSAATDLLRLALTDLANCHLRHVFILLDVRFRSVDMISLHSAFARGAKESRSQVVELLDNMLPKTLRQPLLEVMGEADLQPAGEAADLRSVVAGKLEEKASDWVTAGAVHAASQLEIGSSRGDIRRLLAHDNPVVRETALFALERLEDRSRFLEASRPLTRDTDDTVRELAIKLNQVGWASPGAAC
jgi:ATP:ADP antiporter, AAA family